MYSGVTDFFTGTAGFCALGASEGMPGRQTAQRGMHALDHAGNLGDGDRVVAYIGRNDVARQLQQVFGSWVQCVSFILVIYGALETVCRKYRTAFVLPM